MRQHTRGPAPTPVRANHKHVARTHKKVRRAVVTSSDLEALLLSLSVDQATVMHRDGDQWVAETKAGTDAELDLWMGFMRYRARHVRQTRKAAVPAASRRARTRSRESRERRHVARTTSSGDSGEPGEPPLPATSSDPSRWVSGVAA